MMSRSKNGRYSVGTLYGRPMERFVFAVVVYFVAGIIIKRVKFNKTGTDVIPNKEFWFTLPFLVKDGVLFTFSPCIKWWENRRSGYSSVK